MILLLLFACYVSADSLRPHGPQQARLPRPSPSSGVCPNSCPSSRWCHPAISSSVVPSPPTLNLPQHQWWALRSFICYTFKIGGFINWKSPTSSGHVSSRFPGLGLLLFFPGRSQGSQWLFLSGWSGQVPVGSRTFWAKLPEKELRWVWLWKPPE